MEEGRQQNAGYLSASAAAERLQRNVQREHSLCTDFLLAFWQARACAAEVHVPPCGASWRPLAPWLGVVRHLPCGVSAACEPHL